MLKTKIVCTLGPASSSTEMIEKMIDAGMNVARLNFSHGTYEEHAAVIERLKEVRSRMQVPLAIMLDTKGPEVRIRKFDGGSAVLETGADFTLTTDDVLGDASRVTISYDRLPGELTPGDRVLLDDGNIELVVRECVGHDIRCEVTAGGVIKNGKGVNIPNVHLHMAHMSEKDKSDLLFGIEHDVDFVAASFIRSRDDVVGMRKFLDYNGGHQIRIISKIENLEGVGNFDEILDSSDGIMVARGDMGVEVPFERLPGLQKRFIKACYQSGKMVVTATQMLESMIEHPNPTRAEISDVANAVYDGTSATMLSGESAAGKYPVQAVAAMARIAEYTEREIDYVCRFERSDFRIKNTVDAISHATCGMANDVHAKAIVVNTLSGKTARMVSRFRPAADIVGFTTSEKTWRKLALSWGVTPQLSPVYDGITSMFTATAQETKKLLGLKAGDKIVLTGGLTDGTSGNTDLVKIQTM